MTTAWASRRPCSRSPAARTWATPPCASSAHLTTTKFLCDGKPLSPQAAQRYYVITPTNGSNVTADLTLYYLDGAANSEANGLDSANLRIFHCEDGQWRLLRDAAGYPTTGSGAYTTGSAGAYNWVTISGHDFNSFSPFAITEVPSTNPSLSNLQVFSSSVNIPLTPGFAVATTEYTATVANAVVNVTVKPVITQTNATVQVNGMTVISGSASSPIALVVGANVITTVVTAQDGWTTQTYTVTITRASQSRLSDLQLSAGPLNPSFIAATQAYTVATVPFAVDTTLVTATAEYAADPISVSAMLNGAAPVACSGASSPWACPLGVGQNVISVTVTAADNTAHVYTVTLLPRRRCFAEQPGAVRGAHQPRTLCQHDPCLHHGGAGQWHCQHAGDTHPDLSGQRRAHRHRGGQWRDGCGLHCRALPPARWPWARTSSASP